MAWFFVSATWVDVMALSLCAGILACVIWVIPAHAPEHIHNRLWRGFGGGVVLLTVASAWLLASRTLEFSGAPFASLSDYLPLVLHKTQYGLIWQVRMLAVASLWICWLAGFKRIWRTKLAVLAMIVLLVAIFSRSATGHAGDQGIYAAGVWVDCAHLLASGIWVGSLISMTLLVFPALMRQVDIERALPAEVFTRLSRVATAALIVIVASGVYNALHGLDGIGNLGDSRYGQILLLKVMLVFWMVYIGGHNRYHKLPALRHSVGLSPGKRSFWAGVPSWRPLPATRGRVYMVQRCARAVRLESVLGIFVLGAAAVLHHGMPPADMQQMSQTPTHTQSSASIQPDKKTSNT